MFIKRPRTYSLHIAPYIRQFYQGFTTNAPAVTCVLPEHHVMEVLAYGTLGMNQRTLNKVRAIRHLLSPLGIPPDLLDAVLKACWIALREFFYAVSGVQCGFLTHEVKVVYLFQTIIIGKKT